MRYFIIAGEPSGDIYGGELIRGIRKVDPSAKIQFYGGDFMAEEAGHPPLVHISELAVMGFWEVLMKAFSLLGSLRKCKEQITAFKPDSIIFIDYGGFNLRMAKWAKQHNYATFYYIAPKTWAWKENRVKKIRENIDHIYAILPFEEEYFNGHGVSVSYHGHPLKEVVNRHKTGLIKPGKYTVALLPGSRAQEVLKILPVFLNIAEKYPDWEFYLAKAPSSKQEWYDTCIASRSFPNLHILEGKTYDILDIADLALVASGTATLETAIFRTPQVVCYKANAISFYIAKQLVKLEYVSLVNLILNRESVKELLQSDMTTENIIAEIERLNTEEFKQKMLADYDELYKLLSPENSTELIVEDLMGRLGV